MVTSSCIKITMLNPDPARKGKNIDKSRYDAIHPIILEFLKDNGPSTFSQIAKAVNQKLTGQFDGSIDWYTITVKQDMEARGEIIRVREKIRDLIKLAES
jgi:hypothetical protein